MKHLTNYLLFSIMLFCFFSCKRNDLATTPTPVYIDSAGKGGTAKFFITPRHHGKPIDSCMIYVKYKAQDIPTAPYDDSAKCKIISDIPVATFDSLFNGNYYFYAKGYDTSIAEAVNGGLYQKIITPATYTIDIAVTE